MVSEGSDPQGATVAGTGRRVRWIVATALLVVVAAIGGLKLGWSLRPAPRTDIDATTIVSRIRRIARLATVETHEAQIVKVDATQPVFYLFESRKDAVILVKGRVLAGVDLEKARIDLREGPTGRILRVRLPPAEILAVDPEVEFWEERQGWWNAITPADRTAWLRHAKKELEKAAIAGGALKLADEHARALVDAIGTGLGCQVVFADGVRVPSVVE